MSRSGPLQNGSGEWQRATRSSPGARARSIDNADVRTHAVTCPSYPSCTNTQVVLYAVSGHWTLSLESALDARPWVDVTDIYTECSGCPGTIKSRVRVSAPTPSLEPQIPVLPTTVDSRPVNLVRLLKPRSQQLAWRREAGNLPGAERVNLMRSQHEPSCAPTHHFPLPNSSGSGCPAARLCSQGPDRFPGSSTLDPGRVALQTLSPPWLPLRSPGGTGEGGEGS